MATSNAAKSKKVKGSIHTKKNLKGQVAPKASSKKTKRVKNSKVTNKTTPASKPSFFKVLTRQAVFWLIVAYIGSFAALLSGFYLLYQETILSFKVAPVVTASAHLRSDRPTRITIDSANIDISIVEANIQEGIWQTSQTEVTHLSTSARPAENGNIVLYGHNMQHIFGNLPAVKMGDRVVLTTEEGQKYYYQVADITVVDPSQIQTVLPTQNEVLTVYTCTGFLDSKRLVLKAVPVEISSL